LGAYAQLALGAVLVTTSELLLKRGASSSANTTRELAAPLALLGIAALGSWWTWLGILSYLLSFASWLCVLRLMPLGTAFALINVVHVLVPLGARIFLHESISTTRWTGIALVLAGTVLVAQPAARAESTREGPP
jgi:undecaprenyl phosphate-alpha-L-ara4N flippase subunit ArnE